MSAHRGEALAWAVGLGFVTGIVAGPVAAMPAGSWEVVAEAGVAVASGVVVYVLISRDPEYWQETTPLARFVAYFVTVFAGSSLVTLAGLALAGLGPVRLAVHLLGVVATVGLAVWLTFLGGLERVLDVAMPALGLEW